MKVFVPYHISGVWKPIVSRDPVESGSLGIGIVLSSGVTISTEPIDGGCELELDPTTRTVLKLMGVSEGALPKLWIKEDRPLGYGYGASASRALALSLLIEVLMGKGSFCRAGEVAHVAEVICGSGLGDVIAEALGMGIAVRLRHGPPCKGIVDSFIPKRIYTVITVPLGRMTTSEMHAVYGDRIARFSQRFIEMFLESPSIHRFVEVSHLFSKEVGFLTKDLEERVSKALAKYLSVGVVLGFFIKKKLLVVIAEKDYEVDVASALRKELGIEPFIDLLGIRRTVVSFVDSVPR